MSLLKNGIANVNTEDPADIQVAKDDLLALINATDAQLTINGIYPRWLRTSSGSRLVVGRHRLGCHLLPT